MKIIAQVVSTIGFPDDIPPLKLKDVVMALGPEAIPISIFVEGFRGVVRGEIVRRKVELVSESTAGLLPCCDPEIFKSGVPVAVIIGQAALVDAIVNMAKAITGLNTIDWHYAGGRAVILTSQTDEATVERIRQVVEEMYTMSKKYPTA